MGNIAKGKRVTPQGRAALERIRAAGDAGVRIGTAGGGIHEIVVHGLVHQGLVVRRAAQGPRGGRYEVAVLAPAPAKRAGARTKVTFKKLSVTLEMVEDLRPRRGKATR